MRFARHPEVLWRSTSRGPVLLRPDDVDAEVIGGVAAAVWEVLDAPLTDVEVNDAIREMVGDGGLDDAAALAELEAALLVQRVP